MIRRLLFSYLSITAFVLLVLEIPLALTFANSEREQLSTNLERDARVLATLVEDSLQQGSSVDESLIKNYQATSRARVLITDHVGISVADSDAPQGRDYSTRPEVAQALSGRMSSGKRYSRTLEEELVYVAVPVASGGKVFGTVRVTYPSKSVENRIQSHRLGLLLLALIVLGAVALIGFILALSVTRPVAALEIASAALASGDWSTRAAQSGGAPELRRLGEHFNQMASRIEVLIKVQQDFLADASHQLRTPLTALRLRLENLEGSTDDPTRDEIAAAIDEVGRLTSLVDQLLRLARTETQVSDDNQTVDLAEVIRERQESWGPYAAERDVALKVVTSGSTNVRVSPGSLEQVIDNLLSNAIEVAPSGSSITMSAIRDDNVIALHVVDEGPGMTEEQRSRAFDRFWRGPGTTGPKGTGLGLAIVRRLAEASHGEVGISPGPGGGLDVWVRFPVAHPSRAH